MRRLSFLLLIAAFIGHHAYQRYKRKQAHTEVVLQKSAFESFAVASEQAKTETKIISIPGERRTPYETETAADAEGQELLALMLEDKGIREVAGISWVSCEALFCQLTAEAKTEHLTRFKRAFVDFIHKNPNHGPYWKIVPSEDYERAMRIIFSNKPI